MTSKAGEIAWHLGEKAWPGAMELGNIGRAEINDGSRINFERVTKVRGSRHPTEHVANCVCVQRRSQPKKTSCFIQPRSQSTDSIQKLCRGYAYTRAFTVTPALSIR